MAPSRTLRNVIDTCWSSNLAYALGLIASDGYLAKSTKRVQFVSKDFELVVTFLKALNIKRPIRSHGRGGSVSKDYFLTEFKSVQFYDFLIKTGITPAKSRTIKNVAVPEKYFADFLRGLFDGDGTFWTSWDRRWPRSFVYNIGLSSASSEFVVWLKNHLSTLYGVKGYICRGAGVYTIRYVKRDSRKIFSVMYYQPNLPHLHRKHDKILAALEFDRNLRQSMDYAAVAQW